MNLFWYGVIASQLMGAASKPDPIKLDLQVEDSGYCRQGSTVMLGLHVRLIIRNRGDSPLIVSRIHRAATIRWTSAGERKRAKRIKLEGLLDLAFLSGEPPRRDLFEIVPAGGVFDASAALLRIPLKPGMLGRTGDWGDWAIGDCPEFPNFPNFQFPISGATGDPNCR